MAEYAFVVCATCQHPEFCRSWAGDVGHCVADHRVTPSTDTKMTRAELIAALAECYRLTGADPDGDEDWRLAQNAVDEVRRLRVELDAAATLAVPPPDETGWRDTVQLVANSLGDMARIGIASSVDAKRLGAELQQHLLDALKAAQVPPQDPPVYPNSDKGLAQMCPGVPLPTLRGIQEAAFRAGREDALAARQSAPLGLVNAAREVVSEYENVPTRCVDVNDCQCFDCRLIRKRKAALPAPPDPPAMPELPLLPMETAPKTGEVLLKVERRAGIPNCYLVGHYMPGGYCIEAHPAIDEGWYFWNGCMFDRAAKPVGWVLALPSFDAKHGPRIPATDPQKGGQ